VTSVFSPVSIITHPAPLSPLRAVAALDLITEPRIGAGLDFPARLVVGVTLGRASTIRVLRGSFLKTPSDCRVG
jgi:hypothetical protein